MALNFPDSPSLNDLYTDPTTGFTYQWNGEVWKSAVLSNPDSIKELTDISSSFNGITTSFSLAISGNSVTPTNAQQLIINLGGVIQNAGNDYTVSGSTLYFTTPPSSGLTFTGIFVGSALALNTVSSYAVEPQDLTTGGPSWNTSGDVRISGVGTVSNTGSATTALYVAGGARITGILTVGSSSVTINGVTDRISVGTGLTISSSGITAGVITATTFYGDGSNLTGVGVGSTANINTTGIITASYFYGSGIGITNAGPLGRITPISYSPAIGATNQSPDVSVVITFNKPLVAAAGTITIRSGSASGSIVESFDVQTSPLLSISGGVLTINPTDSTIGTGTTYFVVVPENAYKDILGSSGNVGITTYSFTTATQFLQLFSTGQNHTGQLGQNDRTYRSSPIQIPGIQWSRISSGADFGFGIKTDGTLWAWGNNQSSRLGQNSTTQYSSPRQIPGTQWSEVGGAYNIGIAKKTDNTLWVWGQNNRGNLGQNDITYYSSPRQIPGTQWNTFSSCYFTIFATKTDGTLWSWGSNQYGELGINLSGQYRSSPTQIPGTQWGSLGGGGYHMSATKTDGTLWAWGYNGNGNLGLNDTANRLSPVQVPGTQWNNTVSVNYVGMFTRSNGTLWSCGYNNFGALGQNDRTQYSSPRQIPGTQWDISLVDGSSSAFHTIAKKTDGTLWMWGQGSTGQLIQNSPIDLSSPVQVPGTQWTRAATGYRHSFVMKSVT